jgi:hypothetical protein
MNGTKRLGKGKFTVAAAATALNLAKAHMNTLTTIVARKAYARSRAVNMNNAAWTELNRYRTTLNARARVARAAKKTGSTPAPAAVNRTNTVTYGNSTYVKANVTVSGRPVYKKVGPGVATYYGFPSNGGKPVRLLLMAPARRPNGSHTTLRNYRKTNTAPTAPSGTAAPGAAAPPGPTAALRAAIAHVNKLKTHAGRVRYAERARGTLSAANHTALVRHVGAGGMAATLAAAARVPLPNSGTPRITTAERNVRLAAIRARLNALRAARREAMPKRRNNVHKRLRNAVARVRTRLATTRPGSMATPVRSMLNVPFCHAPASVPRKPCRMRTASVLVYTSPLINDGTVVATRKSDIDLDWFKRQDTYVKNLSDDDFWTAQAHTNRSHSWIGPFLYQGSMPRFFPGTGGRHIAPLWPQIRRLILSGTFKRRSGSEGWRDAWIEDFKTMTSEKDRYTLFCNNTNHLPSNMKLAALRMYQVDLKRIIAAAPKSRKKMVLYRGASFDIFKDRPGHWLTLNSFCSAAYNLSHSLGYGSTLQRITVLPGTPVLLVAGMNQWDSDGEFEIMVNIGTKYLIRARNVRRGGWTGLTRILRVTDVTITK